MQERTLKSWSEFQSELAKLYEKHSALRQQDTNVSDLLFRGQGNSSWDLRTSLERASGLKRYPLAEYCHIVSVVKPEIESITERRWDIPDCPDYVASGAPIFQLPLMAYMAYLRHHGFPSPILDWTESPYVAAYFAFANGNADNDSVAIYVFLEITGKGKSGWASEPKITSWGPTFNTHKRHFLQRCQYTLCTRPDGEQLEYVPHEKAFERNDPEQDQLWKFTIPRTERSTVLRYLDRHNITAFSLFASEDRLMESLAIRAFVLDE